MRISLSTTSVGSIPRPRIIVALALAVALAVAGILLILAHPAGGSSALVSGEQQAQSSSAGQPGVAAPATAKQVTTPTLATLAITPQKPTVGTQVEATASGLPPNTSVELTWKSSKGEWVIEDYYHFKGKKLTETVQSMGQGRVGPNGRLKMNFTIPEDYGGVHDVLVTAVGGSPLAQGGVEVTQSFEMSPREGPVGTEIEVRVKGIGWRTMESTWVVNWDNSEVGWVSALSTHGSAVARFRATGPVGIHQIKLYTGYMGQSYLNFEQAPNAYLPRPDFTFNTTPGSGPMTYAEPYQPQIVPPSDSPIGAHLGLSRSQGPVETAVIMKGDGLPANATLSLVWGTWVGSRVSGQGFEPKENVLGTVKTDAQGRLDAPVTIPSDLGGLHTLVLKDQDDKLLARTSFAIETSIVSISPKSGPAGTKVTIHLKGVGWTEYDNIYVADYDNAYMGYICGFNSQGDVVMNFTAGGQPGIHLIDFYPGIYQGPGDGQQLYRLPQLTYAEDHPGNKIPALHFAFEITR